MSEVFLTGEQELAAALETKSGEPQVGDDSPQVEGTTQSSENPNPSSTPTTPSREDIIASLTWEEIKNLEHLKPALKSEIDSEAARQNRGTRSTLETQIRQEVTRELYSKHFDDMDEETLADVLRKDENARNLYAMVKSTPPPSPSKPDPQQTKELESQISYYTNVIQNVNSRVQKLDAESKSKLDPQAYFDSHPDVLPEKLVADWQNEVIEAEVKQRLAASTNNQSKDDEESKRINNKADSDPDRKPLTDSRSGAGMMPDYGTRSDVLLEMAIREKATAGRS